jgi:hypothetical protein
MALITGQPSKQTRMKSRVGMTGSAVARKARENTSTMTTVAGKVRMSIGERENTVVETGRFPTVGGMAVAAIIPILTAMGVIPGMTAITGGWRAFEDIIDMATATGDTGMCTSQFKRVLVVIEAGRKPAVG